MTAALSARREAWRRAVYRFGRSGLSVTGLVLVLLLLFLSIFGPWLAPYPEHITGSISTASRFGPPSAKHWFGTNEMGQDVLSLVLGGARVSVLAGLAVVLLGAAVGTVVGAVAGVLVAPTASLSPNSFDILLIFAFTAAVVGGLDSLIGAVAFGIGTGLVLALVTGYGEAGDAPIIVLILLAITLVVRPGGVFGRGKSRAV